MTKANSKSNIISYHQAIEQLNKGTLASVYLIFGEEKYLHDDLIERIINISLNTGLKEFNFDVFYANETPVDKIINAARSYPMMAERRVILVKDIQHIKSAELKYLANYIEHPSKSSSLILTMTEKSKSSKLFNMILEHGVAVECRQLYDNEIPGWVENYLKSKRLDIDRQAILLLQAHVGNSLLNMVNELEKIEINIYPSTKITLADVQNVTSISKQFNIFELCNAVGEKNFAKAITILNKLLEQGEPPTGVIIQLIRHIVNLLKVKESIHQGKKTTHDLMKITGLNYYFVNDFMNQAKNFTSDRLRDTFNHLAEADLHLKTGYQKPALVMELLLFRLIKGGEKR